MLVSVLVQSVNDFNIATLLFSNLIGQSEGIRSLQGTKLVSLMAPYCVPIAMFSTSSSNAFKKQDAR